MELWNGVVTRPGQGLAFAEDGDDPGRLAEALRFQAIMDRRQGRHADAASNLRVALNLARRSDSPQLVAQVLVEWGDLKLDDGDTEGARRDWIAALASFEAIEACLQADIVRAKLSTLPESALDARGRRVRRVG